MAINLLLSTLVSRYYEISLVKLELDCLEHFDAMHSLKKSWHDNIDWSGYNVFDDI